jgi:cell division GTPase FtsZ
MLSLRVGDFTIADEVQNRVRIRRSSVKGKRAGFDMPLHSQAATALQEYIDTLTDRASTAFVFPGRRPGTRL